jgi:trigger factor
MKYEVEVLSPVKRKVAVTVLSEEVDAALAATTALYKQRYEIKGFRKGKAPASVIEAKYKAQIYNEATTDLINLQINEIMAELGLTPVSRIDVDAKVFEKGKDFAYTLAFEIAPEFELPEYAGLAVEEEIAEVGDKDVSEVERRILENAAKLSTLSEVREPKDGEIVTISFGAYKDGAVFDGIKAESFDLTLGAGQALTEFEDMVKTLKTGESGEREITFPKDFINTRMAGQSLTMKATLHAIKKKEIPELTDEVAKKAGGFESVDKMREAIRASYLSNRKQLNRAAAQKKLLDGLLAGVDFPLPPSMVEDRMDRLTQDVIYRLERQGKSLESLGKSLKDLKEEQRSLAEEAVKHELFLLAVAKKESLEVTPQEMDKALNDIARQNMQDFFEIKRYYEENNLLVPLRDRLLADKAVEAVYAKAAVTQVPARAAQ